jgi:hypothetical protein
MKATQTKTVAAIAVATASALLNEGFGASNAEAAAYPETTMPALARGLTRDHSHQAGGESSKRA